MLRSLQRRQRCNAASLSTKLPRTEVCKAGNLRCYANAWEKELLSSQKGYQQLWCPHAALNNQESNDQLFFTSLCTATLRCPNEKRRQQLLVHPALLMRRHTLECFP